jgi:serine O-acetyltransferase
MRKLFAQIIQDLPSAKNNIVQLFIYLLIDEPFKLLVSYRIICALRRSKSIIARVFALWLQKRQLRKWSCEISHTAIIGKGVRFCHPIGIVIGAGTKIEEDVKVWQNVTFGSHGKRRNSEKQYPIVKKGAYVYAGAIIIGGVTIGENAIIAANSVVNIDVPPNSIAVGAPCRILSKGIR